MMCQSIGLPPISTIGLGRTAVSSLSREPNPPAKITAFTSVQGNRRSARLHTRLGASAANNALGSPAYDVRAAEDLACSVERLDRVERVGTG